MNKLEPKIIALNNQINSGKMKTNEGFIIQYIMLATQKGRGADKISIETAFESTMVQSTVTSRISFLEDTGMIFRSGTRKKRNSFKQEYEYTLFWYEPNPLKQALNKRKRQHKKFKMIVERLQCDFSDKMSQTLKNELALSLNFQMDLFDE